MYGQPIGDSPKPTRQFKTRRYQSSDEPLEVAAAPLETEVEKPIVPEEMAPEPEQLPEEPAQIQPIRC